MIKKVFLAIVIFIVLAGVVGFLLPSGYDVSRSITIDRPPAQVYEPVANLREWQKWTVWNTDKYPDMTTTYSGSESGVGAKSAWTGDTSGNGSMEITKAVPGEVVEYTLTFEDFAPSIGKLTFTEMEVGKTRVTMAMTGDMGANPIGRYMGLMMDSMMGAEFEASLKGLKEHVEGIEPPEPEKGKGRRGRRNRPSQGKGGGPGAGKAQDDASKSATESDKSANEKNSAGEPDGKSADSESDSGKTDASGKSNDADESASDSKASDSR